MGMPRGGIEIDTTAKTQCTPSQGLAKSLREMNAIRDGKMQGRTWRELRDENVHYILDRIKMEINEEYGFEGDIPRINHGPCGVFAYLFNKEWNARFEEKVNICFIMTKGYDECDHVCISLPTGELYDGGIGIHTREHYKDFIIEDMRVYNHELLERWSYGLNRIYPRFCPDFNKEFVEKVISENLDFLQELIGQLIELL